LNFFDFLDILIKDPERRISPLDEYFKEVLHEMYDVNII